MAHPRHVARLARRSIASVALAAAGFCGAGGCVERVLSVQSDPPGALVYLNDQEVGRTPLRKEFTWYGTYDVAVRMEGHETLKTSAAVIAPAWQWFPIDIVAEIMPFRVTDQHDLNYSLKPTGGDITDPQKFIARGTQMRSQLMSGENSKPAPTTKPATKKAAKPTTRPATQK